jgi:hypothetical protein
MGDHHLLSRIRSEFLEMPGLHLTLPQARRLWHLDEHACRSALDELVRARFLVERSNGSFTRASDGPRHATHKARMAKAAHDNDRGMRRTR